MALALGRTKAELLASISYAELLEWVEYNSKEPIGEWRADYRNAMLMQMISCMFKDSDSKAPEISQFMPFFREDFKEKEHDVDEEGVTVIAAETLAFFEYLAANKERASDGGKGRKRVASKVKKNTKRHKQGS